MAKSADRNPLKTGGLIEIGFDWQKHFAGDLPVFSLQ